MNGCAPAGRGPGRPAGAGGGVAAGPARAKMGSRGGSSGGQRRYKRRVEMSKMQKGKGKGLATELEVWGWWRVWVCILWANIQISNFKRGWEEKRRIFVGSPN